jgi:dienelactone hydrolase
MFHQASYAQLAGFVLNGNPQSAAGATWTFQDTVDGTWYDLEGILFIPSAAAPPYPAIIINHGTGGNAYGYSKNVAQKMVQWNFVCIAANLCHAGGVAIGSPGDTSFSDMGASTNNFLRAMKCRDILVSLSDVDSNCIMAFGHSRGAYTTTGLVATYPSKFACAGHTAGGAISQTGYAAPSTALAAQVTCPYIIHHGDSDNVVPAFYDSTLNIVFNSSGIPHEFWIYPGLNHPQMSADSLMYERTHDWFMNHVCLATQAGGAHPGKFSDVLIYPNPAQDFVTIEFGETVFTVFLFTATGQEAASRQSSGNQAILSLKNLEPGIYLIVIQSGEKIIARKTIVHAP